MLVPTVASLFVIGVLCVGAAVLKEEAPLLNAGRSFAFFMKVDVCPALSCASSPVAITVMEHVSGVLSSYIAPKMMFADSPAEIEDLEIYVLGKKTK